MVTAGCSTGLINMCVAFLEFLSVNATPLNARLSLSEPQEVKMISSGFEPNILATRMRDCSMALSAC